MKIFELGKKNPDLQKQINDIKKTNKERDKQAKKDAKKPDGLPSVADVKKQQARSPIKKADDFMRKSFLQKSLDTMQGATGRKGPEPTELEPKYKIVKKKVKRTVDVDAPAQQGDTGAPTPEPKSNFPTSKTGVQLKPGDVVDYTNQKGQQKKATVNKMLRTKDKQGDLQIQLKKGGATYAIDRDNITSANGEPWEFDPATERGKVKESILKEGGNIFQGTSDFDHKIIPDMMKQVNSVMAKTGVKALPIGSGATPTPGKMSGDLDMIADAGQIRDFFKVKDNKNAKIELEKLFQQAGFETKKTGQIVHVKTNVGGASQQVDIMVVDNGNTAQKFHVHDIPKGSPYKGIHKQIMIADMAKDMGMKWSPYKGLVDRETNELIASDLDEIAKQLLGPNATGKDLGSVESIVKAKPEAQAIVDKYEGEDSPNPTWKQKKVPTESLSDKHLNRIKELMGNM